MISWIKSFDFDPPRAHKEDDEKSIEFLDFPMDPSTDMEVVTQQKSSPLLKSRYEAICKKLTENAEDNEELDIYQITAFMKYYHPNDKKMRLKYLWYIIKSLCCAGIQTIGMVAFIIYVVKENYSDNEQLSTEWCTMNASLELRIIAILFSIYISASVLSLMWVIFDEGLYPHAAYLPKFVANEWVYMGLYCNYFALLCAAYGSFLLIYTASSAIDIVLNSIALYFVLEIDNNLVDHFDSERIAKYMNEEFKFEEWFDDDWFNETEGNVRFKEICFMTLQVSGRQGGCNRLKLIWVFFGGIFTYFATYVGAFGCIVAPFVIAICY